MPTLFGREKEISTLLDAFKRTAHSTVPTSSIQTETDVEDQSPRELVLIGGSSGTGKSALAHTLQPVVVGDGGFFLAGKFELTGRQDPYAAFKAALTPCIDAVLNEEPQNQDNQSQSPNSRLSQLRQAIQVAVAAEGRVLTDMIPSLEKLIGKQEEVTKMSGSEALHRFQYVFCKFCHAISTVVPLVLCLDDLQWGDLASLDLLYDLLLNESNASERGSLLIVATYRDDEVLTKKSSSKGEGELSLDSPFQKISERVCLLALSSSLRLTDIALGALNESSTNDLVAAILDLPSDSTRSLARLVFAKSRGNAFHALQYLRSLIDGGIVSLDPASQQRKWSDRDIQQLSGADDQTLDDLVRQKIENLPNFTQKMLQVASCIGDDVDLSTLSLVFDDSTDDITSSLDLSVHEHLLVYLPDQGRCRFSHDRIRSAVYSCITDSDALSYQIGQKLWSRSSPIVLSASICTIANLVNKGIHKIEHQKERYKVATLNLQAGENAAALHSFPEAADYFRTGIDLLPDVVCWQEEYDITLKLYNADADAELCNQDFNRVALLTSEILRHARNFDDKLAANIAQIYAAGQNGCLNEAMDLGVKVVRQLGVDFPSNPSDFAIVKDLIKTAAVLYGKSDDAIMSLPLMRDERKLTAVHILNMIVLYAVQSGSPFLPLIATKLVQLCLKHGLSKGCAHGFALYSFLVARFNRRQCYRFGRLALTIVEKLRAREMIPCVHSVAFFESNHWVHPLKESFAPLKKSCIQIGLDIGDVEYVCLTSMFQGILAAYSGMPLPKAQVFLMEAADRMTRYKQNNFLQIVNVHLQATCALLRENVPLTNAIQGFAVGDPNHKVASVYRYSWGATLAYFIGDFSEADACVRKRIGLQFDLYAEYTYATDQLYQGLIAVALVRKGSNPRSNVRVCQRCLKMLKCWAKDCPDNFFNKQLLLEAELRSLKSRKAACSQTNNMYGSAYDLASKQGFTQEAALACELAGNYMHSYDHAALATEYWKKAHSLYVEWGGLAKAVHLQKEKGDAFAPSSA